jgi:uncharacterized protein (TIGR03089 family)
LTAASGAEALFAAVLAEQPSRPLITFYNDASGERIELSARSLANWVAKTHFLLLDELGLGVGDTAQVALPADWITVPILLGCWSAGLRVVAGDWTGEVAVAFLTSATSSAAANAGDTFAIDLGSMTRSFGATPGPAPDYVTAVRPQPDSWGSVQFRGGANDPATDQLNRTDLVAKANARATELALAPGARVLSERPWTGAAEWIDALLAPMAVGGSLVLVAQADPARHDRRIEQEQVTNAL